MTLNVKALLNKQTVIDWGYEVGSNGLIVGPGKFESEMFAAVLLYDTGNEGLADMYDEQVMGFELIRQDMLDYGLDNYVEDNVESYYVTLYESDSGFIYMSVSVHPWDEDEE